MRIKTSKHPTIFSNTKKKKNLNLFVSEYRRVASLIIDDLWQNGYEWTFRNQTHKFSIQENKLQFPSFLDYKKFDIETILTARALSSLVTQIVALMKASTEKQRKRLYQLNKMKQNGTSKSKRKLLVRKIKQNIPQKPEISKIKPELSSKCCDFQIANGMFDGFIRLKSILKDRTVIKIPIKWHKHSNILKEKGEMMNSFLISVESIDIRWKLPKFTPRNDGDVIGADQGVKDILTCSNSSKTPKLCPHGHSMESIMHKLARAMKGSKGYRRAQAHRKNFIHWSINQLNLDNVKELRLEKIWNIGYKQKTSNVMSKWTNTIIRDKVQDYCQENRVCFKQQSSTYRSQRCSNCGVVRKANRKGKIYLCKHCNHEMDADLNASMNHAVDLPEIPWTFRGRKLNLGNGFYWLESGIYKFSDGSVESPSNKINLNCNI